MLMSVNRRALRANRSAFTLLEVLVVVAILVILAAVAGVYIFGYLEGANDDAAQQNITVLEGACDSFKVKNLGTPPSNLEDLVMPQPPALPLVDGGIAAITDPWGQRYQLTYEADMYGSEVAVVFTINPKTQKEIYSPRTIKRRMAGQ